MRIPLTDPPHSVIGRRAPDDHRPPLGPLSAGGPIIDDGSIVDDGPTAKLPDTVFGPIPMSEIAGDTIAVLDRRAIRLRRD